MFTNAPPSMFLASGQFVYNGGLQGPGTIDEAGAINTFIASTPVGAAIIFPGNHLIASSPVLLLPNRTYQSSIGYFNGFTFRQANNANLPAVVASSDWFNNNTFSGFPINIYNISIDGNSANNTTSDNLVLMNFGCVVERCYMVNAPQNGIRFTTTNRAGTGIGNGAVLNRITECFISNCGKYGIWMQDTLFAGLTDWFLKDNYIASCNAVAGQHIQADNAAGALVQGNHTSASGSTSISLSNCFATRCVDNYIDGYGAGTASFIAGIGMALSGSNRPSICADNQVNFDTSTTSGTIYGISISGPSTGATNMSCHHNFVRGGGQVGSLAYIFQSQSANNWSLYAHGNKQSGAQSNPFFFVDTHTTVIDEVVLGHVGAIQSQGSFGAATTAAAGANAGTTPPAPVLTRASDFSGTCTFGTGTTPAAGAQVVVTFGNAFANPPSVVIVPNNALTASLTLYVSILAGSFTVNCVTAPAASQPNTTYSFTYHVLN